LKSGHLGYLASDVAWSEPVDPEDPIVRHEHTYFTPHIAGVTHSSYRMMGEIVATSASRLVEFRKLTDIQVVN
jgi:phosphoglycerate dehydrogenase-like enzyme